MISNTYTYEQVSYLKIYIFWLYHSFWYTLYSEEQNPWHNGKREENKEKKTCFDLGDYST